MANNNDNGVKEGEILEELLHGKLRIIQKEQGYRFSVDPILLADFVEIHKEEKVIDLGTGSGVMPLILAHRTQASAIVGIDIQTEMVNMAKRSVALNNYDSKIDIIECDLKNLKTDFKPESFDVVISNPPYIPIHAGKINPRSEKAIARHEIEADLNDVVTGAGFLLHEKGRAYLVYPAIRAVDLFTALRRADLEPKEITFVHSNENSAAKLMLVKSVKGAGPEVTIQKPLYIYNLEGGYTDEASEILENGKDAHY